MHLVEKASCLRSLAENHDARCRVCRRRDRYATKLLAGDEGMARDADWMTSLFLFVVAVACAFLYHMSEKCFLVKNCKSTCSVSRFGER